MSERETGFTIEQARQAFLQDIAIGHSAATVKTYKNGLSRFCRYLLESGQRDPGQTLTENLNPDWAVDFIRWLATEESKPDPDRPNPITKTKVSRATLATYAAALTRFYGWCGTERHLTLSADEYARLLKRLKQLRGRQTRSMINKVPADEIVEKLLAQVRAAAQKPLPDGTSSGDSDVSSNGRGKGLAKHDQTRHALLRLRNIALIETLKSSGARVSEICNLKNGDLEAVNKRARVIGKGNKERWIYFSPQAWQAIQDYLTRRTKEYEKSSGGAPSLSRRQRAGHSEAQPLFCRHDRGAGAKELKPLAPRSVENTLWQIVQDAGLETYITPHKFRHWFATRILAATGDLATTQDLLGHASPATTRIYAQVSEQRKQSAHREVFGL